MTHQLHAWNQYEKYYCEPCELWVFIRQQSSHEKSHKHQNALRRFQRYREREKQQRDREQKKGQDIMRHLERKALGEHVRKDLHLDATSAGDHDPADYTASKESSGKLLSNLQKKRDQASVGPEIPRHRPPPPKKQHQKPPHKTQKQKTKSSRKRKKNTQSENRGALQSDAQGYNDYMKYYNQFKKESDENIAKEREESLKKKAMEHARKDAEKKIRQELMKEFAMQAEKEAEKEATFLHQQETPEEEYQDVDEETLRLYQQQLQQEEEELNAEEAQDMNTNQQQHHDEQQTEPHSPHSEEAEVEYMELDDEEAAQFFGGSIPQEGASADLEDKYYQDPTFFMTENAETYIQQQKLQELEDQIRLQEQQEEEARKREAERIEQERIQKEEQVKRRQEQKKQNTMEQIIRDQQSGINHKTGYGAWEDSGEVEEEEIVEEEEEKPRPNDLWSKKYDYTQTSEYKKRKRNDESTVDPDQTARTKAPALKKQKFSISFSKKK